MHGMGSERVVGTIDIMDSFVGIDGVVDLLSEWLG